MVNFRLLTVEGSLKDLDAGRVAMSLNDPAFDGAGRCVVNGPVTIRGWAYARGGIESVAVFVDGRRHEALRPVVRTDLREYFGADAAAEGGFVLRLDPSDCPPGMHELVVVATGSDGDAVGVEGQVVCIPDDDDGGTGSAAPVGPTAVDWIADGLRTTPRANPPDGHPYDSTHPTGSAWEAAQRLRYRWIANLARGADVLDASSEPSWGARLLEEAGARRVSAGNAGLSLDDNSFDLVVRFDPEPVDSETIAELRRVLRPSGVLLALAPGASGAALTAAFARVRTYRQRTTLASAIESEADETTLRHSVTREDHVDDLGERVVVASDGELPELPPALELASPAALERLHDLAQTWESRALLAEADAAASRVEAGLASTRQEATLRQLRDAEARLRDLQAN
jgi:SAM-dependent methyltransferase